MAGGLLADQQYPVLFAYACAILTAVASLMIVWAIEKALYRTVAPRYRSMGKHTYFFGPNGQCVGKVNRREQDVSLVRLVAGKVPCARSATPMTRDVYVATVAQRG